jgi:hypothetical protein
MNEWIFAESLLERFSRVLDGFSAVARNVGRDGVWASPCQEECVAALEADGQPLEKVAGGGAIVDVSSSSDVLGCLWYEVFLVHYIIEATTECVIATSLVCEN